MFGAYLSGLVLGFLAAVWLVSQLSSVAILRTSPDGREYIEHKGRLLWVQEEGQ